MKTEELEMLCHNTDNRNIIIKHGKNSGIINALSEYCREHDITFCWLPMGQLKTLEVISRYDVSDGKVKPLPPFWWPKQDGESVVLFDEYASLDFDDAKKLMECIVQRKFNGYDLPNNCRILISFT